MKLYQGLLAAALLLSRIEASYSIDKEQAKNANDAPTAPNVRVHFPTMEERINWFDPIEDVTERMEKVIESTRADNRLVIKDQMPEKLAKLRENYQRWKAELDNKPAELQLKPHGEGNQQARASKAFGRSQIYYDEHLINLQYNYDLANLNLIYAAQHEKLLGDLPRRSNIVTQTVALVKYVKKCQTLTTKFEFDKDILDAKLRYNKENLDRSHLDELTKVMNPTVDSRSPQDLLKEACLKLKYKPVVKPQIDWKMVFGSPEYRVLYEYAELLAHSKVVDTKLTPLTPAKLMNDMLLGQLGITGIRSNSIPESYKHVAMATLADYRLVHPNEEAMTRLKLVE